MINKLRRVLIIPMMVFSTMLLSRCTVAVLGGGATAGAMARKQKSVGECISDMTLAKQVAMRLYKISPDVHARVAVNVYDSEVLLTGTLPSQYLIGRAETVTWRVRHVKHVYNNIEESDVSPMRNYARDAFITSQIKTKLLSIPNIRALNFTIKTTNNVVYLIGIARSQDELDNVINVASHVKGAKRVISYIKLDSPA